MRDRSFHCAILALVMVATAVVHAASATLSLGSSAPDFQLKGFVLEESAAGADQSSGALQVKETQYGLADFAQARVLVLIFTCNHCPTAQAYEKRIMQLATDELGLPVVERRIDRTELYVCDEAFFCGTGVQVAAIARVDHRPVGQGSIGPITSRVRDLYFSVVRGEVEKYAHWCTPVY